jgi:hypothetical protein
MIEEQNIGNKLEDDKCLNCGVPISKQDKYCKICGQKNIDGRISFRQFISDFFETVFNLDSRFFKTIPALLVPGKLTKIYFSGRHNAYIKPLRLFFTTMILFYAVLGFKHLNKLEDQIAKGNPVVMMEHALFVDSVIANIGYDTLTSDQRAIVDTIVNLAHEPFNHVILKGDQGGEEKLFLVFGDDSTDISLRDIYTLPIDSIFEKYHYEGFREKFTVRQTIVLTKYPGKVLRFLIGNTSWMILIMLPAVAGFMQLIYIRRKTYFIEHLVFLYHFHAAMFLVMTIFLLLLPMLSSLFIWAIQLLIALFFLIAMKVYYRQNWFKTIAKYILLGIAYVLLTGIFGAFTAVVSFFIYQ